MTVGGTGEPIRLRITQLLYERSLADRDQIHRMRDDPALHQRTSGVGDRRQDVAWANSLSRRDVARCLASSQRVEVARVHAD
jgi:hypothetical protein